MGQNEGLANCYETVITALASQVEHHMGVREYWRDKATHYAEELDKALRENERLLKEVGELRKWRETHAHLIGTKIVSNDTAKVECKPDWFLSPDVEIPVGGFVVPQEVNAPDA